MHIDIRVEAVIPDCEKEEVSPSETLKDKKAGCTLFSHEVTRE